MKNKMLKSLALLALAVFMTSCGNDADIVKEGSFVNYPLAEIGDIFETNFDDGKWDSLEVAGRRYVTFNGKISHSLHDKGLQKFPMEKVKGKLNSTLWNVMENGKDWSLSNVSKQQFPKFFEKLVNDGYSELIKIHNEYYAIKRESESYRDKALDEKDKYEAELEKKHVDSITVHEKKRSSELKKLEKETNSTLFELEKKKEAAVKAYYKRTAELYKKFEELGGSLRKSVWGTYNHSEEKKKKLAELDKIHPVWRKYFLMSPSEAMDKADEIKSKVLEPFYKVCPKDDSSTSKQAYQRADEASKALEEYKKIAPAMKKEIKQCEETIPTLEAKSKSLEAEQRELFFSSRKAREEASEMVDDKVDEFWDKKKVALRNFDKKLSNNKKSKRSKFQELVTKYLGLYKKNCYWKTGSDVEFKWAIHLDGETFELLEVSNECWEQGDETVALQMNLDTLKIFL